MKARVISSVSGNRKLFAVLTPNLSGKFFVKDRVRRALIIGKHILRYKDLGVRKQHVFCHALIYIYSYNIYQQGKCLLTFRSETTSALDDQS